MMLEGFPDFKTGFAHPNQRLVCEMIKYLFRGSDAFRGTQLCNNHNGESRRKSNSYLGNNSNIVWIYYEMMGNSYLHPPLLETICAITFPEDTQWDPTISGRYYEKISDRFPLKTTKSKISCDGPATEEQEMPDLKEIQFFICSNKEKNINIEISDKILIIRVKKPYPSWDDIKEIIYYSIKRLTEIISVSSCEIKFQYNNLISSENGTSFNLEVMADLFNFRPYLGGDLPKEFTDFIVGCEFPLKEVEGKIRVALTTISKSEKEEKRNYFLNITCVTDTAINTSATIDWVDKSHEEISKIFEATITEKLRKRFRGS